MRGKQRIGVAAAGVVLVGAVVLGIGANPRYIEELRVGGGYGDPVDGGADLEKDGDIRTDGDVTAATYNGIDLSSFPQTNIDDSDEGQEFPGTDHTADQATNAEEELDAIRHMLSDIGGETNWYDAIPVSLKLAEDSISNTATGHNHDAVNSHAISQVPGDLSIDGDVTIGDNYAVDVLKFDSQVDDLGGGEPSHLMRFVNPRNLIPNGGAEVWLEGTTDVPTGWSIYGGIYQPDVARESTDIRHGDYSIQVSNDGDSNVQTVAIWISDYQMYVGKQVSGGMWAKCSSASSVRIRVEDGVSSTYSSYHSGGGDWELLTVTRTVDASATRLRLEIQIVGNGHSAYCDDVFLVEGPMEWAYEPGGDRLGYVNLPLAGWWDSTSTEGIDVADTDPAFGSTYVQWTNTDTDWIATTIVIPEEYDSDANDAWFVGYYSLDANQDNVTLDLRTRLQQLGSTADATDTNYDHTAVYHGSNDQNVDRAVYKIGESMIGSDVLVLKVTRADDGVDTAGLTMRGGQLVYVKR